MPADPDHRVPVPPVREGHPGPLHDPGAPVNAAQLGVRVPALLPRHVHRAVPRQQEGACHAALPEDEDG